MKIKILNPLWGHEHLPIEDFLVKTRDAEYDGIETWIPQNPDDGKKMLAFLRRHDMILITHQHEAKGNTFDEFKRSFLENLKACASFNPVLINSHTGRDWFTKEQNAELIDIAAHFSSEYKIVVAHETHRGRLGYAPSSIKDFLPGKSFFLTADFSHWTCVTESMLENFDETLSQAITRSRHIHARIGFEQAPQVPDPRDSRWQYALDKFFGWWDRIVEANQSNEILTITTEFGPPPYMPVTLFEAKPVADQFEINCYMKDLLRARYL